jgi:hypothetical protein
MSEAVQNLVHAIAAGDAIETETAFGAAMAEKLSAKMDDMRQAVAQSMFAVQEQEPEVEAATTEEENV